jgi:hypothetical protein
VKLITSLEGIMVAQRRIQRRVSADWRKHRSMQRFFQTQVPDKWDKMQHCDLRFIHRRREYPREGYKVISLRCRQVPFCFRCAEHETNLRVQRAYDAFFACKPARKAPRFMHIVQTAPIYANGTGWGNAASKNIDAFFNVVWATLKDTFGDGIGAKMTYQDFGSLGPQKTHPHIDLTLNGWRLLDGKAVPIRYLDLKRGDLQRWNKTLADHARVLGSEGNHGNPFFGQVFTSAAAYFPIMAYQLRELWDFGTLTHPDPKTLVWHSYKGGQHAYPVGDFFRHMLEYQRRLGMWGHHQASNLHRLYGHMAKGQVGKTMRAMSGIERSHRRNCNCGECQEWFPYFPRAPGDASRAFA